MAVKSSGTISLTDLTSEFGGSTPISISQFYRGGGRVPNGVSANNNIPTSGQLSISQFYGSVRDRLISGGSITSDAVYVYHTFTANGSFVVGFGPLDVNVWVIGGGGGANANYSGGSWSGGGGGCAVGTMTLNSGTYGVSVGSGGWGSYVVDNGAVGSGGASTFNGIVAYGGGGAYYPGAGAGGTAYGGNVANYTGGSGGRSSGGGAAGGYGSVTYSGAGGAYGGGAGGAYGGGGGCDGYQGGNGAPGIVVIRYAK